MTLEIPIRVELSDEEVNAALRDALRFYHWTPVTEGLPTEEGCYLVTSGDERHVSISRFSLTPIEGHKWAMENVTQDAVIAWALLPEPYEED